VSPAPLAQDERFRDEAERFQLRWVCEDCGLFDAARGCAHGYPVSRHDRAAQRVRLTFCKDFES
jgi:hypothetical protein